MTEPGMAGFEEAFDWEGLGQGDEWDSLIRCLVAEDNAASFSPMASSPETVYSPPLSPDDIFFPPSGTHYGGTYSKNLAQED